MRSNGKVGSPQFFAAMKTNILTLSLLFANAVLPAWAGPAGWVRVSDPQHAAGSDTVQREEVAAGRRLTPTELAELREQVRRQWAPASEGVRSSGERMIQGPAIQGSASPASRGPRP